ncbi:hypothetical protein F5Y07DRAFT_366310 [Xylaria sp. FL0933]|nr:hypothetical protein F5Y07DRAFT_366310 [Xylaria sp. FL0933]
MASGDFDIAQQTIILSFVFTILAILSFFAHITVRIVILRKLGLDDWLTGGAFVITLALVTQTVWAVVHEGQGRHVSLVTHTEFELLAKSLLVHEELWALVNILIRLSASIAIKALFGNISQWRILSNVAMTLSILHGVFSLLIGALVCRPLNAAWDPTVEGTCINQTASFIAIEAIGLAIDILVLAVPCLVIPRLMMSRKRQWALVLLLSSGSLVTIITGVRIAALHRVGSLDVTYDQAYLGLLSTLGALLSIIASCVPSFGPIYKAICKKLRPLYITRHSRRINSIECNRSQSVRGQSHTK